MKRQLKMREKNQMKERKKTFEKEKSWKRFWERR